MSLSARLCAFRGLAPVFWGHVPSSWGLTRQYKTNYIDSPLYRFPRVLWGMTLGGFYHSNIKFCNKIYGIKKELHFEAHFICIFIIVTWHPQSRHCGIVGVYFIFLLQYPRRQWCWFHQFENWEDGGGTAALGLLRNCNRRSHSRFLFRGGPLST